MELSKEFLENIDKKHLSRKLCEYTWNVLIAMNKGYGFKYWSHYVVIYS